MNKEAISFGANQGVIKSDKWNFDFRPGEREKKGEFGLDTENVRAYLKQETNFFSSLDNPGKKKWKKK